MLTVSLLFEVAQIVAHVLLIGPKCLLDFLRSAQSNAFCCSKKVVDIEKSSCNLIIKLNNQL